MERCPDDVTNKHTAPLPGEQGSVRSVPLTHTSSFRSSKLERAINTINNPAINNRCIFKKAALDFLVVLRARTCAIQGCESYLGKQAGPCVSCPRMTPELTTPMLPLHNRSIVATVKHCLSLSGKLQHYNPDLPFIKQLLLNLLLHSKRPLLYSSRFFLVSRLKSSVSVVS